MNAPVNIIIIDNNDHVIHSIKKFIKSNYNNVIIEECFDAFYGCHKIVKSQNYDLLILGALMTYWDGAEILKRTYEVYTPVAILVGNVNPESYFIKQLNPRPYVIHTPIDFKQFGKIMNDVKIRLKNTEVQIIDMNINETLDQLNYNNGKYSISLKNIIKNLICDTEDKGSLYDRLSKRLDVSRSMIQKQVYNSISEIDEDKFKLLGFNGKPKNKDFLNALQNKITTEIKAEKLKKKSG